MKILQNGRKRLGGERPGVERGEDEQYGDGYFYYKLLGECYTHGMMDGQAVALQNNEGIMSTVFGIR
jgi:hypothetical protein